MNPLNEYSPNMHTVRTVGETQLKIQLNDASIFNKILKLLKEKDTELYSFQNKSECTFQIVLRNLHFTTDIQDINDDIEGPGYKI